MDIPDGDTRVCRAGCGREVILAITHKGKNGPTWTPMDPEPAQGDEGRWSLAKHPDDTRKGYHYEAVKITHMAQRAGMKAAGVTLHTSHGITCPNRDAYMRRNRGAKL